MILCENYLFYLDTKQQSLLFQIDYPEISDNVVPKHRFMSGFEQHVEAPDRRWQYLLFAAEPYETISFKVESSDVFFSIIKRNFFFVRFQVVKLINRKENFGLIIIQKQNRFVSFSYSISILPFFFFK
jgi:hypothetical protein